MGETVVFAPWFLWFYTGSAIALTAWAAWWLVDVVRRPADRFHTNWPSPKLRWGIVPAAWLLSVAAQLLIYFGGLAIKQGVAAQNLIDRTNLGLITFAVLVLMLVFGFAYLLRVVFPSPGRVPAAPLEDGEDDSGRGDELDVQDQGRPTRQDEGRRERQGEEAPAAAGDDAENDDAEDD